LIKEFDEFFKLVSFDTKEKLQTLESHFRQTILDLEKRLNFIQAYKDPDINQLKLSIKNMVTLFEE